MKTPDIPENEESRLEDLKSLNILDTPFDERFDRLTRMARRIFNMPITLVSLVDENRQWFKSCIGLGTRETARDISFCGHAILGSDVFIIPDAEKDDRFSDNPLVLNDPFIRFYAGCPLRLPNGNKMGTLCIIDTKPRNFEEEDIELLKDLASMVESEFNAIQAATLDELTQISNRRGFNLLAQKYLEYCKRNQLAVSLVFFDLNDFKQINDNYGHTEGDKTLTTFAELMTNNLRHSDIFARLGGDEFVALLIDTSEAGARWTMQKLQISLDQYNRKANRGYDITFSHGLVEYQPDKHANIEDLLIEGDAAMYQCKKQLKAAHSNQSAK